jgi:hypothetical protein
LFSDIATIFQFVLLPSHFGEFREQISKMGVTLDTQSNRKLDLVTADQAQSREEIAASLNVLHFYCVDR